MLAEEITENRRGVEPVRGSVDSDSRDFAESMLPQLARAAGEASYLLDHGYPRDSVMGFVGNRYLLTARQRLLLARVVSGEGARMRRAAKMLPLDEMAGETVLVDGFNTVITLEVALAAGPVLLCQDGTVRDLAGLKGTYHPIAETFVAADLILDGIARYQAASAVFLVDSPVSNSGRLCALIRERGLAYDMEVQARTVPDPDRSLNGCEHVISSDSIVLDRCASWHNLTAAIVETITPLWQISLSIPIDYSCVNSAVVK